VTVVVDAGPGKLEAGSYWSAIFVQSARLAPVAPGTSGRGAQMRIVERIGVLLFADSAPEGKPLPADVAISGIKRTSRAWTSASIIPLPICGSSPVPSSA